MSDSELLLCICGCGVEAEYSAHGIRDQEVYDEHWAAECWNRKGGPVGPPANPACPHCNETHPAALQDACEAELHEIDPEGRR